MTSGMTEKGEDHWDSKAYQSVASFVPKLATVVLEWLDVQKDDQILDVGCGDGIINIQVAPILAAGTGRIHGVDSSTAMIESAKAGAARDAAASQVCSFEVLDATSVIDHVALHGKFDKVFSNAAMHWILRPAATRERFFRGVHEALKPGGRFVFEMGGMGNVGELRATFLSVVARRVGIARAREVDPWFFPDEAWMRSALEGEGGFRVRKIERVYRATKADKGGIEGWVRLMGKQFFDAIPEPSDREDAIKEACEILDTVCRSSGGGESGEWFGYVRLRAVAEKM